MFQRILISTDFSDGLYRLAKFVPDLAASGVNHIVFIHNVPLWQEGAIPRVDKKKVDKATQRLSVAIEQAPEGVEVKVEVPSGPRPIDTILKTVKKYHSDLILLGMPSRSLLDEKLFGSTTVGCAQRSPVPLMILRPQLISTYTEEELALRCQHLFRYLLIPYDGSDSANYLVEQVKRYAQNRQPQSLECCLLCWVVSKDGHRELRESKLKQARPLLEAVQADLEKLGLQVSVEVRQGEFLAEILDAAVMTDISAIAVSSQNLGKLREWSIPSATGELLRRSWHPIIFFPPGRS